MSKSPGHQRAPDHQVREEPLSQSVEVEIAGVVVASSAGVIKVDEDKYPARYYFPRADVRMEKLQRSDTTSECPFKGIANYYNLVLGERQLKDAVWTYEEPYDEHAALQDRLAFYDDKFPEIHVRVQAASSEEEGLYAQSVAGEEDPGASIEPPLRPGA